MRSKTALIRKTPLKSLNSEEFNRVVNIDPRYVELLSDQRRTKKSWHDIRGQFKPYSFEIQDEQIKRVTVLAKNKVCALKTLTKEQRKNLKVITVEYENYTRFLKVKPDTKGVINDKIKKN